MHSEAMIAGAGLFTAGTGILAQVIPAVPDDFKSWPTQALLAFLVLASLLLVWSVIRTAARCAADGSAAALEQAKAMTGLAVELSETNTRLNEVAQKQTRSNEIMTQFAANVNARPCIVKSQQ